MRSGIANLPLHHGKAPRWLFQRMEALAGSISEIMVLELGRSEFLRRMSDPFWFQAVSCILGFDWHSRGTTTVTGGAFKQALRKKDLGIFIAGGKGRASNSTLLDIEDGSMRMGPSTVRALSLVSDLIYGSKASWKDPVRYSFAVGGKDGVPYPVNRRVYDRTIGVLESAVNNTKLGNKEKAGAISRLRLFAPKAL